MDKKGLGTDNVCYHGVEDTRTVRSATHGVGEYLKVHKIENFFGSDFEFCTISLLLLLKY